jgi:hypothetical protein
MGEGKKGTPQKCENKAKKSFRIITTFQKQSQNKAKNDQLSGRPRRQPIQVTDNTLVIR